MRALVRISIICLVLVGSMIAAAPYVVNFDDYARSIYEEQSEAFRADLVVEGPMHVTLFPHPRLQLNHVTLKGQDQAPLMQVAALVLDFDIAALLQGQWRATGITLLQGVMDVPLDDSGLYTTLQHMITPSAPLLAGVDTIVMKAVDITIPLMEGRKTLQATSLDTTLSFAQNRVTGIHGEVKIGADSYAVSAETLSESPLQYRGTIKRNHSDPITWHIAMNPDNGGMHWRVNMPDDPDEKPAPNSPLSVPFQADVTIFPTHMQWDSIAARYNNIDIRSSGSVQMADKTLRGDLHVAHAVSVPSADESLALLNRLIKSDAAIMEADPLWDSVINTVLHEMTLLNQVQLAVAIKNTQAADPLTFAVTVKDGVLVSTPVTYEPYPGVRMSMAPRIEHNGVRPLFSTDIRVNAESIQALPFFTNKADGPTSTDPFYAYFHMAINNRELRFENIQSGIGVHTLDGYIAMRRGEQPRIDVSMQGNRVHLPRLREIHPLVANMVSILDESDGDGSRSRAWLGGMNGEYTIELYCNDCHIADQSFDKASIAMELHNGVMDISRFALSNKDHDVKGSLRFDIRLARPQLTFEMTGPKLNTELFTSLLAKAPALDRDAETPAASDSLGWWDKTPFHLLPLDAVDGTYNVKLSEVVFPTLTVRPLIFRGTSSETGLQYDQIGFGVFGGKMIMSGQLRYHPLFVQSVYSFANMKLEEMLAALGAPAVPLKGYISMSGSFKTTGASPHEWISNLSMESSLAGRNIEVPRMDIDGFIQSLSSFSQKDILKTDEAFSQIRPENKIQTLYNVDGRLSTGKGVLRFDNVQFDTRYTKGVMGGVIMMPSRQLSLKTRSSFSYSALANSGYFDITMKGSLDNVETLIDISSIRTFMQQAATVAPVAKEPASAAAKPAATETAPSLGQPRRARPSLAR